MGGQRFVIFMYDKATFVNFYKMGEGAKGAQGQWFCLMCRQTNFNPKKPQRNGMQRPASSPLAPQTLNFLSDFRSSAARSVFCPDTVLNNC